MTFSEIFTLDATTQGPLYPPSEAMDADGNFVVVGKINTPGHLGKDAEWGAMIAAPSKAPPLGENLPYETVSPIDLTDAEALQEIELYTLPNPIPTNNYAVVFAPDQLPSAHDVERPSRPLREVSSPDMRIEDGPIRLAPITLRSWLQAHGTVHVEVEPDGHVAFTMLLGGLIPNSLYTVMSLRQWDLRPQNPTRPGPLGIPNAFVTDDEGQGFHRARLFNPFPTGGNRIINIVVLWMSEQRSYGGAIGHFGLGVDVHAQLKMKTTTAFDHIESDERMSRSE